MASCYPGWWASSSGAGATTHPKPHHAAIHSRARAHSSCSNPARRVASLPPKRSKIDGKELIKLNCQGAGENATAKRADPSAQRTRGGRARERCKENKRLLTNINISLKCFTAHSYMDSTTHTHACSLARSHLFRLVYRSQRLGDPVAMHFTPLAVRSAPCSLMQRCPRWKMVSV